MADERDLRRIVESARRVGLELDENEAVRWMEAIEIAGRSEDIVVSTRTGVFGHRVTMLDFSDQDLEYFRRVGELVEIPEEEGVETALALSGSAAQSKIQTYPGDSDYFQRINIHAPTRSEACSKLADLMLGKARSTFEGETFRLVEVKFGNYPAGVVRGGELHEAGSPIAWSAHDMAVGLIEGVTPEGEAVKVAWHDVADDPGWCKLDWVVADPVRRQVANASNMLDVTWEAPDGSITPLDGYLDPYFQEVYLDAEAIPLFTKLAAHVSADALDDYVEQLRGEVHKYVAGDHPNYGKVAKRLYNVFRYEGRYAEAAYIREIFDEPATVLYQVYAIVRSLEEAATPATEPAFAIDLDALLPQLDRLILDVVRTLEGVEEEEIVAQLLRLRDSLTRSKLDVRHEAVVAAQSRLLNLVNNFFREKLTALPEVRDYLAELGD